MKVRLKYPLQAVKEPVLYQLIMDRHVVPNILRAHIDHEAGGEIDLFLEGEAEAIKSSLTWLESKGVTVSELPT